MPASKLFFILMLTVNSVCAQPVTTVYRSDFREPGEVFSTGFHNWGENDSIEEHVQSTSSGLNSVRDSAFVSTSWDRQSAINVALLYMTETPFYIYDIRATDNFYNVPLTLDTYGYEELHEDFEDQHEYAALGGISAAQIISATRYTVAFVQGIPQVTEHETTSNPNYERIPTQANERPYPATEPYEELEPIVCANYTGYSASMMKSKKSLTIPFNEKIKTCESTISSLLLFVAN